MSWKNQALVLCAAIMLVTSVPAIMPASAASARKIDSDATVALRQLYATMPAARNLARRAKGILVFPRVVKAGFFLGAQYGNGALRRGGRTVGYYRTTAVSYGLQAGAQRFGYAMFFMTNNSLGYLRRSGGWEAGSAPSVVVFDNGAAGGVSTTSIRKNIYVFFFNQRGLMAGLGLQGTKITRITPGR